MTNFWFTGLTAVSVGESEYQKQTDFAPQISSQLKQRGGPRIVAAKREF